MATSIERLRMAAAAPVLTPRIPRRGDEARGEGSELTARQRARMADLSLLLDVVLKTTAGTVRREFCRCGLLHQLQARLAVASTGCRSILGCQHAWAVYPAHSHLGIVRDTCRAPV